MENFSEVSTGVDGISARAPFKIQYDVFMAKIDPRSRSYIVGLFVFAFFFDKEDGATVIMSSWRFMTDADIGINVAKLADVTEPAEPELGVTT